MSGLPLDAVQSAAMSRHFAELAQAHRSSMRTTGTHRPAAAAASLLPGGSRELLDTVSAACDSREGASPEQRAIIVLAHMYAEAATSAAEAQRDPLRFSEAALVISASDSFVEFTRRFCRTVEAGVVAAAPSAVRSSSSAEALAERAASPRRGGDKQIIPASSPMSAAAGRLGVGSDSASSSLQSSFQLLQQRLDGVLTSVNALINYCSQLESSLRSASEFRKRISHVVTDFSHALQPAKSGQSSRIVHGEREQEALIRAVVRETQTDLEYAVAHKFVQYAKQNVPDVFERLGKPNSDLLDVVSEVLSEFYRRWRQKWDEDRRQLQTEASCASEEAQRVLREFRRVVGPSVDSSALVAEPNPVVDESTLSGSSQQSLVTALPPNSAIGSLVLERSSPPVQQAPPPRVAGGSRSAASLSALRSRDSGSTLRGTVQQQRSSRQRELFRAISKSRRQFDDADEELTQFRDARPLVPVSSPLMEQATAAIERSRPASRLSRTCSISTLQRAIRQSGPDRGSANAIGAAAVVRQLAPAVHQTRSRTPSTPVPM